MVAALLPDQHPATPESSARDTDSRKSRALHQGPPDTTRIQRPQPSRNRRTPWHYLAVVEVRNRRRGPPAPAILVGGIVGRQPPRSKLPCRTFVPTAAATNSAAQLLISGSAGTVLSKIPIPACVLPFRVWKGVPSHDFQGRRHRRLPPSRAAQIDAIECKTVQGVDKEILVLRVQQGDLTVRVPAENVDLVGVRVVSSEGLGQGVRGTSVSPTSKSPPTGPAATRPTSRSWPPATWSRSPRSSAICGVGNVTAACPQAKSACCPRPGLCWSANSRSPRTPTRTKPRRSSTRCSLPERLPSTLDGATIER